MIEKLGFEKNKRIVKVYNNQRVSITIGGQHCHFRSKFEYNWALYLQFLKDRAKILYWEYEPKIFYFEGERRAPVQYTPDFALFDSLGHAVWQECKGHHDGPTNTKLRLMAKHYPDEVMELVLMRIPKNQVKGANRRRVAAKYTRRIIDASEIFRQVRGLINFK